MFWFVAQLFFVEICVFAQAIWAGDILFSVTLFRVPSQTTITSFDPVSDFTPAAVFTEAHDSWRLLILQGKRRIVEMNTSGLVREDGAEGSTVSCLAITERGGYAGGG